MSGLLLGILLARTVAGLLASLGGWRTVYWVASVLMVIMALALWRGLPKVKQENHLNYPQLLASVFSLFTRDKLLRTRAVLGCLTFANFSILWTSMAFLLAAPPFNYSEGVIGLFGLAGAAGALGAPGGWPADKGKSHMTTSAGLVLPCSPRGYLVRTRLSAGANCRYSGTRPHRAGRTYHQPDRDLPRETRRP